MGLVTAAQARQLIRTSMSDEALQAIIDREEAILVQRLGPHQGPLTEIVELRGSRLFTKRPIQTLTSINGVTSLSHLTILADRGEIIGGSWSGYTTIVYEPQSQDDERRAVLIELVRIAIERTALKSESIAGEYSYQAPEWEAERRKLYSRLQFREI